MDTVSGSITPGAWEQNYTPALERGLELVNSGELHKLVLAVRQTVSLTEPLDPQPLLQRLRHQQAGSCRFLGKKTRTTVSSALRQSDC